LQKREEELKIGGIFSLTGYLSWSGKYKRKAAELKVNMVNEAGGINGRPLRMIAYDDHSSADQAEGIAETLIFKHRVVAMVGTGSLPLSRAVATVANRYRTPVFINSGYAIDPLKDNFVFNTAHKTEFAIACSFRHFLDAGMDRLALLMPVGPLGDLGSWLARRLGALMGISIVGEERFDVSAPDVAPQLRRLTFLKPLALFSFVTGQPAAAVSATMAAVGMKIPLLVSHGNANPRFLKLVSSSPVHIVVPSGKTMALDTITEDDPCKNAVVSFNSRHLECYGEPANYYSAELADAVGLVVEALRRTGDADPVRLRDAAESIRNYGGMQGVYDMSPIDHYGTGIEQIVLLTIKDGRWRFSSAFSSIALFEDFHGNRKTHLIRRMADLLASPDSGRPVPAGDLPSINDFVTAQTGLNCTDLKLDVYFAARLYYQQKRELTRSLREREFQRGRAALFRLLTVVLLQSFEDLERLKLAVLELFLALFDVAIEEGGDLEEIVRLRQRFTREWEGVTDNETLCLWIVRVFDAFAASLSRGLTPGKANLLNRVLDFVGCHFDEPLPVERLGRELGMSSSRLIHRMKSEHNVTIGEIITKVRIDKAKTLLRNNDVSIGAIAQEVGYRDQCYFTRIFKKRTGFTPKDYRNHARLKAGLPKHA
jgi:branched-chain amino acid transport system substrate-binding protein